MKSVSHVLHLDKRLLVFQIRKVIDMFTIQTWFIYWPFITTWHRVTVFFVLCFLYVQTVEIPPLLRVHIGARPDHMVSQEKISCSFLDCNYLFWSTSRHLESRTHVVSGAMDEHTAVTELWDAWGLTFSHSSIFFILEITQTVQTFRLSRVVLYQLLYSRFK